MTGHEFMRLRSNVAAHLSSVARKHLDRLKRTTAHHCDGRVGLEAVINAAREYRTPGDYVPCPHEGPPRCPTCDADMTTERTRPSHD